MDRTPCRARTAIVVAALLLALWTGPSLAHAQDAFVGGGLNLLDFTLPTVSLQGGGVVAPHVELRGTLDSLFFIVGFFQLGADVLYTAGSPRAGATWYVGGGPQLYVATLLPSSGSGSGLGAVAGIHLTGGVELPLGPSTGFYVEMQPGTPFTTFLPLLGLRAGINLHL